MAQVMRPCCASSRDEPHERDCPVTITCICGGQGPADEGPSGIRHKQGCEHAAAEREFMAGSEQREAKVHWGNRPSTAVRAAGLLQAAAEVLLQRDGSYRGADAMYADVMARLFPEGVRLESAHDHHRFHLLMLLVVKLTRYVRNYDEGHHDSLTDLVNYGAMLQAIDRERPSSVRGEGSP